MTGTPSVGVQSNYSVGGKSITFRYIQTNHNNISILKTNGQAINLVGSHGCGINGTFYYQSAPQGAINAGYSNGMIYRVSVNGGASIMGKGEKNRLTATADGNCGTILCYNNTLNGKKMFCIDMKDFNTAYIGTTKVALSAIKWAVGGSNLYLDQSFSNATEFGNAIGSQDENKINLRNRTAILINPNSTGGSANDVVLLAAFAASGTGYVSDGGVNGISLWNLREYCRTKFPGYVGINVDGGGSTAISYFNNNAYTVVYSESPIRKIPAMIHTEMPVV